MYQDLLETETALSAAKIAEDVARTKVSELQAQVSNLEIDAAWQLQTDNTDVMVISKLLDAAHGWSDVALPKVKDALNKIYLSLFNSTIEEGQVKDNLSWAEDLWVTLNEGTLPPANAPKIFQRHERIKNIRINPQFVWEVKFNSIPTKTKRLAQKHQE